MTSFAVSGKIKIELAGAEDVKRGLSTVDKLLESTGAELQKIKKGGGLTALALGKEAIAAAESQLKVTTLEIQRQANMVVELRDELSRLAKDGKQDTLAYAQAYEQLIQAEANVNNLSASLRKLPMDLRESTTAAVGFLGDIDTGFQTTAGFLNTIGSQLESFGGAGANFGAGTFQNAAQAIAVAGEIFAVLEQLPRLSSAYQTLMQVTSNYFKNLGAGAKIQNQVADAADDTASALQKQVTTQTQQAGASTAAIAANQAQATADTTEATASIQATTANQAEAASALAAGQATVGFSARIMAAGATMASTALAFGAALAPIAAIGVTIEVAKKVSADTKKVMNEWLATFPDLQAEIINTRELALSSSSDTLQATIQSEQRKKEALEKQIADLEKFVVEANKGIAEEASKFGGSLSGLPKGLTDISRDLDLAVLDFFGLDTDEAEAKLKELQGELKTVNQNLDGLNDSYVMNIAATNDYIESLEAQQSLLLEQVELTKTITEEERQARLEQLETEQEVLNVLRAQTESRLKSATSDDERNLLEQQIVEFDKQLREVGDSIGFLTDNITVGIAEQRSVIQEQLDLNALTSTITQEQVDAKVAQLESERAVLQEYNDLYRADLDDKQQRIEQLRQLINAASDPDQVASLPADFDLSAAEKEYADLVQTLEGGAVVFEENAERIAELDSELTLYNTTLTEAAKTNEEAAEAARELQAAEEATKQAEEERARLLDSLKDRYAANEKEIADLRLQAREQEKEWIAEDTRERVRAAQISVLEQQIAAAQRVEEEQEAQAEIQQAARDAATERKKIETDLQKELVKLETDYQKSIKKINQDYMQGEIKANESLRKAELQAQKEYNKQRADLLRDLNENLLQAAENNDVTAFVRAQRQGDEQLSQLADNADEATQERQAQFEEERRQRYEEFQLRLQEERDSYEQQRAERQQAAEEARQQLQTESQQRLEQLRQQGEEEKKQSEVLQGQLAALREKFAAEDKERERNERRNALAARIEDIRREQSDILTVQRTFGGYRIENEKRVQQAMLNLGLSTVSQINQLMGRLSGVTPRAPRTVTPGGRTIIANAEGGIYTQPTIIMAGERPGFGDAVVPFSLRASEGFEAAMSRMGLGGGRTTGFGDIKVDIGNMSVGEIVTPAQLDATLNSVKQNIYSAVINAVSRLLGG